MLNGLLWKWTELILSFLRLHPSIAFGLFCRLWGMLPFFKVILAHRSKYDGYLNWLCPFPSILVHVSVHSLPSPAWPHPIHPDSRAYYSRFLCSTALHSMGFTFTSRHIHSWASFLLWPSHFMLPRAISNCPPLFPSSILDTFQPGGLNFQCLIVLPFIFFTKFSQQKYWSGLPFASSVGHSSVPFSSVTQSCPTLCNPMSHSTPGLPVHHQLPRVYSDSCPSSQWCHPAISSSVVLFSSCPQSLPSSGSFPVSQLFAWGGQSIGVSASTSVLPVNTQDWSPLWWTGWISLQSKGLLRVFSNTTVQKHQFFCAQLSS